MSSTSVRIESVQPGLVGAERRPVDPALDLPAMPLTPWINRKPERSATPRPDEKRPVPDGLWSKCAQCNKILYQKELVSNLHVCTHCGHHYPLSASERIACLVDEGSFIEWDAGVISGDPLRFDGAKPYRFTLRRARGATGLSEAVVGGRARLEGRSVALCVMDFRFVGGSMGSAVGERVVRLFERSLEQQLPVVVVTASGGARMQEGMHSLLQMAKTSAAVSRFGASGLPYLSVLTNPTTGGVTASFASLADVILAEPGALIGFAGPRVIEQTIRQKLPRGFQSAEFLLEHGMIDQIVPRSLLKQRLGQLLDYLAREAASG